MIVNSEACVRSIKDVTKKIPNRTKFVIPMVTDSSNAVWYDIRTGLDGGRGWHIVGWQWTWENIDPTEPLNVLFASTTETLTLQLHRNIDNTTLLNFNDDDLMAHWDLEHNFDTSGQVLFERVFKQELDELTTQKRLRCIFRSLSDVANISLTTVQLAVQIFYYDISTPNVGHTKLGRISEF